MIIPDYVKIEYVAKNELFKKQFVLSSFLISLAPLVFLSASYLLLKNMIGPILYFAFVFIAYIVLSILTLNKSYRNYYRYFGHDELAFSDTHLYYNICMNKAGEYVNLDSNVEFVNIKSVNIKRSIGPDKLYIFLKDETYLTFHSIKDIEEVKKKIENKLNKSI